MELALKDKFDTRGIFFIAPAVIFLFLIIIYPLFTILPLSFQEYIAQSHSFVFVGLKQYQRLLSDSLFWLSIKTTLIFTIVTLMLHLIVGWALALLLNAEWPSVRMRNFFRGVLILPYIFSPPAAALLWGILYHPLGLLPYLTQQVLHTRIGFLSDPGVAMFSVLLANAWNFYPLYMILLLGGLQSIPKSIYDAAKVDGANWLQSFLHITLPQMRSLMMTIIIIDFITTFIHFDLVWIMTKGGPLRSTYLISFFLYEKGLVPFKFGYASAVSLIIALFISIFLFIYVIFYSKRWEFQS